VFDAVEADASAFGAAALAFLAAGFGVNFVAGFAGALGDVDAA
jgi:hypothetical protein